MFSKNSDKTFRGFITTILNMQRKTSNETHTIFEVDSEIARIKNKLFKIAICPEIQGAKHYTLNIKTKERIDLYRHIAKHFKNSDFVTTFTLIDDETDERVAVLEILL